MRNFTDDELKNMDLETAKAELGNALYEASKLIELLEYQKSSNWRLPKVTGNGHHLRQRISEFGAKLLEERWNV